MEHNGPVRGINGNSPESVRATGVLSDDGGMFTIMHNRDGGVIVKKFRTWIIIVSANNLFYHTHTHTRIIWKP